MADEAVDLGLEIERIAQTDPDRLAIADPSGEWTYGELLSAARGLAASLPPASGEPRRPVTLVMPHGAHAIVALVSCLLAGRPYCAISPAQPRQRLEALLVGIDPERIWVTNERKREGLEALGFPVADPIIRAARERSSSGRSVQPLAGAAGLCAIYPTSGTSGVPKLVGYRHAAVRHRVESYAATLSCGPEDRFSLVSPLWTAAAASSIFTALLSGASLHVLDVAGSSPSFVKQQVRASQVSVWHSTPSLFRRLGGAGLLDGNRFRFVRLTGERVLPSDVQLAQRICDAEASLVTGYSLTEANGAVSQKVVPLARAGPGVDLDSGRPLSGLRVSIENGQGMQLEAGIEGEIVVAGDLLSAGYLRSDQGQNGTRFAERDGEVALFTGDYGVLHADGSLEVRGRVDRRLKIHGQRVDPSEVEAAALTHKGVLDAALVPFRPPAGGAATALFAVSNPEAGKATRRSLQAHLGTQVAPEAVPALVEVIDGLPRTPAGKVDRLRLTRLAEIAAAKPFKRRRNDDPLVAHMVRLWQEALELDDVAADDDLFAAGGDSLASAEICAAVETTYGLSLQPAVLLEHRSPVELASHVRGILEGAPQDSPSLVTFNPSGDEPPLFVVPGAGSDATALVHFADAIGPDQPVKVIQLPGADGSRRPATRMTELRDHCMRAIRDSSVPAPYRIAGTSFGGLVAYEVGSELLRAGKAVAYLGLFDTTAPSLRRGHYLTRPFRPPLRRLLADYRMVLRVLLGRRPPKAEDRFRHLRIGCSVAADRWTPKPIPAPLHLYRCDRQPPHLKDAPYLGWEGLPSQIEVRGVPARHSRHIRPPAVARLAELVNEDLRAGTTPERSGSAPPAQLASS